MVSESDHKAFQQWHLEQFGYEATSRSTEPGQADHYENPFTNGAWKAWLYFKAPPTPQAEYPDKCVLCQRDHPEFYLCHDCAERLSYELAQAGFAQVGNDPSRPVFFEAFLARVSIVGQSDRVRVDSFVVG